MFWLTLGWSMVATGLLGGTAWAWARGLPMTGMSVCSNPGCNATVPAWAIGDGVIVFTVDDWAAKKAGKVPPSKPVPGLCMKCRREAMVNPLPGEPTATFWRRERKENEDALERGRQELAKALKRTDI